ncbi:MAG TPA: aspartyl protease family protein [Candidatus Acidoferrales bacterium]|nr:aspartyl protease family protein [Candidatus Acidoferrales bacterium]
MGLTYIEADIANPRSPRKTARLRFLVDSGAVYSVAPATVLWRLGIPATSTRNIILADGPSIKRRMGEVSFRINGHAGTSPVIFGQKEDSALLGSVSLEVLGFFLDPLKRELRPLPMILAPSRSPKS